jgi:hypothetical protein
MTMEFYLGFLENYKHILQQFPMDPRIFGLLVAILAFLVSLLINLLQRRYTRARTDRMLAKEESLLDFLARLHESLGRVESACKVEIEGASSPREVGQAIHAARNQIQAAIVDVQKHLRSFGQYRSKEKAREKHQKNLERLRKKRLGK